MNAMLTADHPLPRCLFQGAQRLHRRRRVGGFDIDPAAVRRFNGVLQQFAEGAPLLDADRVATAGRELWSGARGATAACIRLRLRRVKAAQAMVADRAWQAPAEIVALVQSLIGQIRRGEHLLPGELPRVGHLDDALLIDMAWPRIESETSAYVDFHRLRRLACERAERARFDRDAWLQARDDEARLLAHERVCREASYLSGAPLRFSIH